MKIKNIDRAFEQEEIKTSKYNKSYYHSAEVVAEHKLGDMLSDLEYQYVIAEKSTAKQAKAKLLKAIKGLRCAEESYLEALKSAPIELCYFPVHYMRLDRYKYTVGFEGACRSRVKDFGNRGKKSHMPDLFASDADMNEEFFDVGAHNAFDAHDEKYKDVTVLGSNDMARVITFAEFGATEGKEITQAEYQVLQTVYFPIWVVRVESDEEIRYTYISDCTDTVNMTVAYNQSVLEDIAHQIRKPRKFFWRLADIKFYLWSWLVICALCFATSIILNLDIITQYKHIEATGPLFVGILGALFLHAAVYFISYKVIGVNNETTPLLDSITIGVKKAKFFWVLFVLTYTVIPVAITAALVLIDKL